MSKPLLFYSQKDNSINFEKRLSKDNKLNEFIKICVQNNNKKIPKLVTNLNLFILRDVLNLVNSYVFI